MNDQQELTDVIPVVLPYDGPHDADSVLDAAASVSALVRYLNNATGPWNAGHTLEFAPTIHQVLTCLDSAVYGLNQLLTQLAGALERQANNPTLYDDRGDRSGNTTAHDAAEQLATTRQHVTQLNTVLNTAQQLTTHLGHR